jgi:hypothetical protein
MMIKDPNDSVLVTTDVEDGVRVFHCKREPESRAFLLLCGKLSESSCVSLPNDDGNIHWLFVDKRDEESFLEAFKWFIIYE